MSERVERNDVAAVEGDGLGRRRMLGMLAGGVAAIGLTAGAINAEGAALAPPEKQGEVAAEELYGPARLRSYKSRRSSSWDRSGGNADAVPVEPGASATVLDVQGAGVITHIWFTIASEDDHHLKNLVLRAWWDGEATPSIEAPIGDFFGLGLGEYFVYQSELLAVASVKALNAYFKMPFEKGAKITVSNEGKAKTNALYFAVDYVTLPSLPTDLGRFHAQYRQAAPCKGVIDDWTGNGDRSVNDLKNLDGKDNYVFLEAAGRGHFVGVTQAVLQNQNGWFGEGDDMIFIDGDTQPTINGTGTEDYYNGAWDFSSKPFAFQHNGAPYITGDERLGGRYCLYRWHTEGPLAFEKSIRVTIEHGHGNSRSDDFFSVAYWYQTEPHATFPALPPAKSRIPKVFRVGGAGAATPGE
ncbi:glycoside hydrolase family 172 protein [Acidicapsa dinghuensis]|uniref:Glycoside hydrolase family 172 protein n=1 Tax=Acidicapsa dinghuensis TaxID=2218256 RepID=A0ABW1EG81_9BACT|nr:glycoside hydrolase family 172 protein [Acidicapsa dinghuensis]